jgi:dolichol-phosphate mannosyltransferase
MRPAAWLWTALLASQGVLAARVIVRLLRTAGGERLALAPEDGPAGAAPDERVSVIVPVLNERGRLGPCLDGLRRQGPEVAEILVVDGGSRDGTPALVRQAAEADPRIRLLQSGAPPEGANGKSRDMDVALQQADPRSAWILTMDADVRPRPGLVRALVTQARQTGAGGVSVAATQELSGVGVGWVHPALLATLVYRFGIPGHLARRPADVQANGQCLLLARAGLVGIGGFAAGAHSLCDDVTIARLLARDGWPVGFYESDGLVSTRMYETGREAWRNWGRSLPLRDGLVEGRVMTGLAEVLLVLGLPWLVALLAALPPGRRPLPPALVRLNLGLLALRIGVLLGIRRAYVGRPWSYWLSPLLDLPAALHLIGSALRREHAWRGRRIRRAPVRAAGRAAGRVPSVAAGWGAARGRRREPVRGGIS